MAATPQENRVPAGSPNQLIAVRNRIRVLADAGDADTATALATDALLAELGLDGEIQLAALLDTLVTIGRLAAADLAGEFGARVAALAKSLSELNAVSLGGKPELREGLDVAQAEALRRMLLAIVTDPRLVVVRLAHQLAHLRSLKTAPPEQRRAAAQETRALYAPLANRLGVWQLKWELEDLAFRYLEPDTYQRIAAELKERRADRERYIQQFTSRLHASLADQHLTAQVEGRPKHIYSIWRKMQRKGLSFERLFDIRAVRVIVADVPACYTTLGLVHSLWPYIHGEFDDYIANPKENGYRSLHTAVLGPGQVPVEVQIRTMEMHRGAELGIAAHWRYKEGGRYSRALDEKIGWLRTLLQPLDDGESSGDFIDSVRSEIFEDRVYVFSPAGEIVDLPAGATPLDYAYHVHTEIGHHCRGAKVNSRMVPLTHVLTSGEQVEIITARNARPSRDWLVPRAGYLASGRSRAKVRAWFRRQDQQSHRRQGRAILDRELQRLGGPELPLQRVADRLNQASVEKLCIALGAGDISSGSLGHALHRELGTDDTARGHQLNARTATADASVSVAGLDEMLSQFARCCAPVPPDPIIGYITVGRGVTIHRENCSNIRRARERNSNRMIKLDWGGGDGATYPVSISLRAFDRQGLLRDITGLLSDEDVSILGTRSLSNPKTLTADITVEVAIKSVSELERLLNRLKQIPNVTDARRG
jgi:GTP pyrophosphokinase